MCCHMCAHTNAQKHTQNEKLKPFCVYIHITFGHVWIHMYTHMYIYMWREGREEMGRRQRSRGEGEITEQKNVKWK